MHQLGVGDIVEIGFRKLKASWSMLVLDAALDEAVIVLVVEMADHFPRFHPVKCIRMLLPPKIETYSGRSWHSGNPHLNFLS